MRTITLAPLICILMTTTLNAATYHVAPDGDDANPGSAERPWKTPHHAAAQVKPGDTVLFGDGTYPIPSPVVIRTQGRPDAWVEFSAAGGATPVFDASSWAPNDRREAAFMGAITVEQAAHVRLKRLHVRNSHGAGIAVHGRSHHVDIQDCRVDQSFAPGIGIWKDCAQVRIVGNEVTHANNPAQALREEWVGREPPHEAISVMGVDGFQVAWNHVHHCHKEGIDVKEVARHGVVHHNWVHHVPRQALYVDAWFGLLEDVEVYSNVGHDAEWGVTFSVEGRGSEMRNVRAHHNVLFNNRGSGVYFGTWGINGPRSGIVVAHNTLWNNGPRNYAGSTGSIDVRGANVTDTLIINNLCANGAPEGAFAIATIEDPERLDELGVRIEGNLIERFVTETSAPERWGTPNPVRGERTVIADPMLAAPAEGDFTLREGSPAIDAGVPNEWSTEPEGDAPDIGAFPKGVTRLPGPPQTTPLEGFEPYEPKLTEDWPAVLK